MKTCLSFLAALVALLGLTGCVVSSGAAKSSLPPDWAAALPKSNASTTDITGEFVELGEQLDGRFTRDGTVNRQNLSTFLSAKTLNNGTVRRSPERGATVELRRADDTHLELITKVNGEVNRQVTLEVEFEKDTGMIVLHRDQAIKTGGEFLAAAYEFRTYRLWRAPDGRLYARGTSRAVGEMLLIPGTFSQEVWCRWDPATPEALARQAAVLAKQAEAGARAAEINRNRATVGTKAPPFTGADVLTGRPVTSADFAGKVIVFHAWSTGTSSRSLNPLQAAEEKYRARGLEIIGLCKNPANEREKVADYIKASHLTWPQLYDGKAAHGEIFEAYYGTLTGSQFCVIDRHGTIAAFARTTKELETALEKALAAP